MESQIESQLRLHGFNRTGKIRARLLRNEDRFVAGKKYRRGMAVLKQCLPAQESRAQESDPSQHRAKAQRRWGP
jgi:hypothetical protein